MNPFTPYLHPTTVVMVDDNIRFIESLSFGLNALPITFKLFSSAKQALEWINQSSPRPSYLPTLEGEALSLPTFADRMYDPTRFNEVSAVIVDYDMPEMNGIALCKAIQNKQINKIILTGIADKATALEAFNNDTIDRFILKQDNDAMAKISDCINVFQRRYFREKSDCLLHQGMKKNYLTFMKEPGLKAIFDAILSHGDYVEYYTNSIPDGIWLIKSNGDADFFVMQSEALFSDQLEIASGDGGPKTLLKELRRDDIVACFLDTLGYYAPSCNWQAALHPASTFKGNQEDFRYALLKDIPPLNRNALKRISFNDFLEQ